MEIMMISIQHDINSIRHAFTHDTNMGTWCGFILGSAGVTGMIASSKPSSLKLLIFMVFDLLAALSCLPLIAFSSMGLPTSIYYHDLKQEELLCATTLAFVMLEAIITMWSLILAYLYLCDCCRTYQEPGTVYYSNVYHDNIRNGNSIQSKYGTPSGYHAVPMRRIENASYSNDSKNLTPFSTNEVSSESFAPSAPMIDDNPIPANKNSL